MGAKFAEQIIESMVDENGHCGERGLSRKQFEVLSYGLDECDWEYVTSWHGNYGKKDFYSKKYFGSIGKYSVVLNWYAHFNDRFTVVSIDPLTEDELNEKLEREAKEQEEQDRMKALRDFSGSEWVSEPKKRLDLVLTLVNDYVYESCGYSYYDDGERHIYTLRDEDGNCYVWKTSNLLAYRDSETSLNDVVAEIGDRVEMKATVKEHSEYKGTKQTVLTRATVKKVEKF